MTKFVLYRNLGGPKMNRYFISAFSKPLMGISLAILSSLMIGHARADIRPIPDPELTDRSIIVVPNHARYKVRIGSFNGVSRAPFGSGGGCPLQSTIRSFWPVNSTIHLKKNFTLPEGAHNLRVLLSVDNDVKVFINETQITPGEVRHEFCPVIDEFLFRAPDDILREGINGLRVRAVDRGSESYFDLRVLVDVP